MEINEPLPQTERTVTASSYGLLVITHNYNEGMISFHEWIELSQEWALAIIEKYGEQPERRAS